MSGNHGQLGRDLIGGSLQINSRTVIDANGKLNVNDGKVKQLCTNELTITGNVCSDCVPQIPLGVPQRLGPYTSSGVKEDIDTTVYSTIITNSGIGNDESSIHGMGDAFKKNQLKVIRYTSDDQASGTATVTPDNFFETGNSIIFVTTPETFDTFCMLWWDGSAWTIVDQSSNNITTAPV